MIIPCIDLLHRKVVQLVQGQESAKALELPEPLVVLEKFHQYPELQVIDLDAAMGREPQSDIVQKLCLRKKCRVGGGIRTIAAAQRALEAGAHKVIVGSSAFTTSGIDHDFLSTLLTVVPRDRLMVAVDCRSKKVAIHGWKTLLPLSPQEALPQLEKYCSEFLCTLVDVEGKLEGTELNFFRSLRDCTALPITAAGGITTDEEIVALDALNMNAALGMSIYRKFFPELFAR
jgi:phosphoribosylformimino-5-aminoimidazole carboxamide ribonucleotide (ProFAR) isomerase